MTRWHLILSGRVQNVGLRFRAKMTAQRFQVTGWIHNLDDGDVELELQGDQHRIDQCLEAIRRLPGVQFSIKWADECPPISETRFHIR
ncbi:MAG: acylphosphatase [Eubacteriales bacterium]|nr:acylphosphatase [Eubacteriales bacterium]